jgi:hypothetical protein
MHVIRGGGYIPSERRTHLCSESRIVRLNTLLCVLYIYMNIHKYMYKIYIVYAHTHIHIYKYIYIYIYIYICMYV